MALPGTRLARFYDRAPVFIQNLMSSGFGVIKLLDERGPLFRSIYRELAETQWWPRERLRELQLERLRRIVRFAQDYVPFYQKRFAEYGVSWQTIQSLDDLRRFPIVTREDVQQHRQEMLANRKPKGRIVVQTTSGSTGTPIEVWCDRRTFLTDRAWAMRHRSWGGYDSRRWRATFNGYRIVPPNQSAPPFWRYNIPWRQIHFSIYHLSERNLPSYVKALQSLGVEFLDGYPSALYILARHLLAHGRTLPMRAVFTGSEVLHAAYRETLEKAFDCKVFDYYGLAEKVIGAGECEYHNGYHVAMEHVVAEVLPTAQDGGNDPSDGGDLVATSLVNTVMPLIRYRCGDVVSAGPARCPCGRSLELVGQARSRVLDIVTGADGRMISPHILLQPFRYMYSILESQIVQESATDVVVRVVRRGEFSNADERKLLEGFQERLGPAMNVRIEYLTAIPRPPSGKFRLVVSNLADSSRTL